MFRLILLSLLPVLLFANTNNQQHNGIKYHKKRHTPAFYPPPEHSVNASAVYEPQTEMCCMGKIQPKNRLEKCCGKGVYKDYLQLCCKNVVHEKIIGVRCCGNVTYNPEKQICCGDHVIDSSDVKNPNMLCCGNTTYDHTKQLCCDITVNTTAILDKINSSSMCCGDKVYNSDNEICCQDLLEGIHTVQSKNDDSAVYSCCKSEVIDGNTQACCGGNISYNLANETCCYSTDPWTVVSTTKPTDQCCGSTGLSFDPDTQLCCAENITEKEGANSGCCGNNTYNMDEEVCCWSEDDTRSIKKESPTHSGCCGDKSYDYSSQVCCSDNNEYAVHPNKDDKGAYFGCCGMKTYDFSKYICCGTELTAQTSTYDYTCCGGKTCNNKKQTCCYSYDSNTGVSNQTLINDYKPTSICCGAELYNQASDKGCCNDKIYDTKSEVCCGTKIISKNGREDRDTCCYPDDVNKNHC